MLGRRGERDAFEVRPLFRICTKQNHLLANVNGEVAEHRFRRRRERVEFFESEGEGDFLFDRNWLSPKWRGYDLYGLAPVRYRERERPVAIESAFSAIA